MRYGHISIPVPASGGKSDESHDRQRSKPPGESLRETLPLTRLAGQSRRLPRPYSKVTQKRPQARKGEKQKAAIDKPMKWILRQRLQGRKMQGQEVHQMKEPGSQEGSKE